MLKMTNFAIDRFVSQELSKLNSCNAPDLTSSFNHAESWVNSFVLNSIFRVNIEDRFKPYVFGILRRAQMGLVEYEAGRQELLDYIGDSKERVSVYFQALYRFELVIMLVYQAYELTAKVTGERLFEKNDGTPIQRLNRVYNVIKHLEPSSISAPQIHAVWITNQGLEIATERLAWHEIADLVRKIGIIGETLANPSPRNGA